MKLQSQSASGGGHRSHSSSVVSEFDIFIIKSSSHAPSEARIPPLRNAGQAKALLSYTLTWFRAPCQEGDTDEGGDRRREEETETGEVRPGCRAFAGQGHPRRDPRRYHLRASVSAAPQAWLPPPRPALHPLGVARPARPCSLCLLPPAGTGCSSTCSTPPRRLGPPSPLATGLGRADGSAPGPAAPHVRTEVSQCGFLYDGTESQRSHSSSPREPAKNTKPLPHPKPSELEPQVEARQLAAFTSVPEGSDPYFVLGATSHFLY